MLYTNSSGRGAIGYYIKSDSNATSFSVGTDSGTGSMIMYDFVVASDGNVYAVFKHSGQTGEYPRQAICKVDTYFTSTYLCPVTGYLNGFSQVAYAGGKLLLTYVDGALTRYTMDLTTTTLTTNTGTVPTATGYYDGSNYMFGVTGSAYSKVQLSNNRVLYKVSTNKLVSVF
jgi:hypothetical protein